MKSDAEIDQLIQEMLAAAVDPVQPGFSPALTEQMLQALPSVPLGAGEIAGIMAKAGLGVGAATTAAKGLLAKKILASAAAVAVLGCIYWITHRPTPVPEGMDRYALQIPEPGYTSSPLPVLAVPNFELSPGRQESFDAPPGLGNIARSATVSSSDGCPLSGFLDRVNDGLNSPDFAEHGLELSAGQQWICLDLHQPTELHAVVVWHRYDMPAAYEDVLVEASDSPTFEPARTTILYNNDADNSLGRGVGRDPVYLETNLGRIIRANATRARYVRLWSNGRFMDGINHYTEVEIWGRP
jgi:hypothetical protein